VHFAEHPAEVCLRFKTPEEAKQAAGFAAERYGVPYKRD